MFRLTALATITAAVMVSCKEYPKRSIPSGTYESESTDERVTATASELRFDLRIETENGTERVIKVCEYNLHPDSEIWTWGYTSWEYFNIYGEFKWYWDGTAIVRQWHPAQYPRRARGPTGTTRFIRRS